MGIILFMLLNLIAANNIFAQWKMTASSILDASYGTGSQGAMIFKNGLLWAGREDIWISADSGFTWSRRFQKLTGPLAGDPIVDIAFFDRNVGLATFNGIQYITHDQGLTWKLLNVNTSATVSIFFLDNSNQIGIVSDEEGAFFLSNDGGVTWKNMIIDNSLINVVYIGYGKNIGNGHGYISADGFFYETLDGGNTWNKKQGQTDYDSYTFGIDHCNTNTIYLVNESGAGGSDNHSHIYKSTNAGMSWTIAYSGVPGELSGGIVVTDNAIYCQKSHDGVLRSTDFGVTWKNIGGPGSGNVDSRTLCALNDSVLLAIDTLGNVWRTDNSGGFPVPVIPKISLGIDSIKLSSPVSLGIDTVCKPIQVDIPITSNCSAFTLLSALLADSTILSVSIDSLPLAISDQNPRILHIHIIPKKIQLTPYTTTLTLTCKQGTSTITKKITVTIDGTTIDPNQFLGASYSVNGLCKQTTGDFIITNPYCDSMTVTGFSFSDSANVIFTPPKLPFKILSGATVHEKIGLQAIASGVFPDSMTITFNFAGGTFTTTVPIQVSSTKERASLIFPSKIFSFGTINICKSPKTLPFIISNPHCYDYDITILNWQPVSPNFSLSNPPTVPFKLRSKSSDTLFVTYSPSTVGSSTATLHLRIEYDGKRIDTTILVSGSASSSAVCSLSDSLLSFDTVSTCASLTKSAYLINDNCDSILISQVFPLSQAGFIKINPPLPIELHSGDSLLITITYTPKHPGETLDSIRFLGKTGTGTTQSQTLVLSGFGESDSGGISYEPKLFNFKSLSICSHDSASGFVTNTGCDSLLLDPSGVFGDPDYRVSGVGLRVSMAPADTIRYSVYLNPAQKGLRTGFLVLTSHLSGSTRRDSIPFTTTVTDGTRILSVPTNPLDFGTQSLCDPQKDTLITLSNTGCDTLILSSLNGLGLGFGSNTNFPDTILPNTSKQIDIFTLLDTASGKLTTTGTLNFTSNSDNTLAPITLSHSFVAGVRRDAGLFLDNAAKAGGDLSTITYDIKETPGKSFSGAGITKLNFDLNYNTDVLNYTATKSTANLSSLDGKNFTLTGSPNITADANGILATIGFTVYLTKDSTTSIILTNRNDTTQTPCGMTTLTLGGSATFDYNYLCGERSLSRFLRDGSQIHITSIHPNPAQDEIEIALQSGLKQDANVEIFNALGARIYFGAKNLILGENKVHLDTKSLSSGVYLVRVGNVSESLVISR